MFCTQCGSKIEDGFKFCPECGAKVVIPSQEKGKEQDAYGANAVPKKGLGYSYCVDGKPRRTYTQEEISKIADEIFWKEPSYVSLNAGELSKAVDIPVKEALKIMDKKYKEFKRQRKQGKFPDTKYCPCCGAQDIETYEEPGITVTQPVKAFGGGFISSSSPSSKRMRCNTCGHRWKPKKRR